MAILELIPREEFERVATSSLPSCDRLSLVADMCRVNALVAVKVAGSGHLGSSFSALDVVVHLLYEELAVTARGLDDVDRDVFFSSKGHDVPGLYAALLGLGVLPLDRLLRLRRLGGLDGHPDIGIPGIEANSGSLGMGISKGRGIALAKRRLGHAGLVVVLTGDGELQEGQNWEALQSAAHDRLGRLWVVVDRNEVQSDRRTDDVLALGDIEAKFRAFGWDVRTCDGHDHDVLAEVFESFRSGDDRPKALVARTIKGKGVSFMEHPVALVEGGGTYRWHAGAPDDEAFSRAFGELVERIDARLAELDLEPLRLEQASASEEESSVDLEAEPQSGAGTRAATAKAEYVVDAYGAALVELARHHEQLVVLDADLASDCRVRAFELAYPERFFECGIAEQDMVSAAAGLARHGLLPVVNSFASFLASRANEQIYNQVSEQTKVVYALHYAGLIPAGPGKSHQSLRDVSLLGALPGMTIVQPANTDETARLLRWAVEAAEESVAIRLAIGPSPRRVELPVGDLQVGRGVLLREGGDALIIAYGPVLLHEALLASELLAERGLGLAVANTSWLNRFHPAWLEEVAAYDHIFVAEDHSSIGGLADGLRRHLDTPRVVAFGVEGWPACGTPREALRAHGLDGASLAERVSALVRARVA